MRRKRYGYSSTPTIALPLKSWLKRLSLTLLFAASIMLIGLSKTDTRFAQHIRMGVTDGLVPVVQLLAQPIETVTAAGDWISELGVLYSENARLRQENAHLFKWQLVARELEVENRKLRELLKFTPMGIHTYTTAKVVGDSSGPYARAALINVGAGDGVVVDQMVINEAGVVGRVVEASDHKARVLLLTDMNSRLPVIGERSRERGIVKGTNQSSLTLHYLPKEFSLSVGERLITVSDGADVVEGLPVGVVTQVDGNRVVVEPYVDWDRLEYVSVVDSEVAPE